MASSDNENIVDPNVPDDRVVPEESTFAEEVETLEQQLQSQHILIQQLETKLGTASILAEELEMALENQVKQRDAKVSLLEKENAKLVRVLVKATVALKAIFEDKNVPVPRNVSMEKAIRELEEELEKLRRQYVM